MNSKITVGLLTVLVAIGLAGCGPSSANKEDAAKSDTSVQATTDALTTEGIVVQRTDRPLAGPPQAQSSTSTEIYLLVETVDANNQKKLIKVAGPSTLDQLPKAAIGDKVKFSLDNSGVGLTGFQVVTPKNLPVLRPQVMR